MTAICFIAIDKDNANEVKFKHLARAFFSYRCIVAAGQSSVVRLQEGADVIINFPSISIDMTLLAGIFGKTRLQ